MSDRRRTSPATFVASLALTLIAGVAGCTSASGHSPSSAPTRSAAAIPVGTSQHSLTAGGQQRTFRVYRPASVTGSAAVPLVVVLHGALGSGQQAESSYGWDAQADAGHFLVAYPDGLHRTWAVSPGCCGPSAAAHVDDAGFITQLVATLGRAMPIDQHRVYATGISNGGMLAYRLACDTDVFAAIGADSSTMLGDCDSPRPISVIHIHGTADHTIPYTGGPGRRDNDGTGNRPAKIDGPPIPALSAQWRSTDDCGPPATTVAGAVTTSTARCPDGRAVELITIAGAGHQWPGQPGPQGPAAAALGLDPPFAGLDATSTIWRFFQAHPKP